MLQNRTGNTHYKSRGGGGELTAAVEAHVHHGCRGKVPWIAEPRAAAGGGEEEGEEGMVVEAANSNKSFII